ncbi:unnamed protein product, partial [Prorocentrum cordatum]
MPEKASRKDKDSSMGPPPKKSRGAATLTFPSGGASSSVRACLLRRKSDQDVEWIKTPGAPDIACVVCFSGFAPARFFCNWKDFAKAHHAGGPHKDSVDAAIRLYPNKEAASQLMAPVEIADGTSTMIEIYREGMWLPATSTRKETHNSTPKQLKIGDPLSLKFLDGQELKVYIFSDKSGPAGAMRVRVGVQARVDSRRTTMPAPGQVVPGLGNMAIQNARENDTSGAHDDGFHALLQAGAAQWSEVLARGDRAHKGRLARRTGGKGDEGGDYILSEDEAEDGGGGSRGRDAFASPAPPRLVDDSGSEAVRAQDPEGHREDPHRNRWHQENVYEMAHDSAAADMDDGCSAPGDDAASVCSSSVASIAAPSAGARRDSRGGKNPMYWIKKLTVNNALLDLTDKRDLHHGAERARKFEERFPADDTSAKFGKHLTRVGVLLKISPEHVLTTGWPEIRSAYSELCVIDHPPIGVALLALVEKKASELATASTPGMSIRDTDIMDLAGCVAPWQVEGASDTAADGEPVVFDTLRPQLHPLAPILSGGVQANVMAKFSVKKSVCQIISTTDAENIASNMAAAVLNVRIAVDTRFDYIQDVETLYQASEMTTGRSVLQAIVAKLTNINDTTSIDDCATTLAEAVTHYKQYACPFPKESRATLEELIHSTGVKLFDKLPNVPADERSGLLFRGEFAQGEAAILALRGVINDIGQLLGMVPVCDGLSGILQGCMHACSEKNANSARTLANTTRHLVETLRNVKPHATYLNKVNVEHSIALGMASALQFSRSVKSLKGSCKANVLEGARVAEVSKHISDPCVAALALAGGNHISAPKSKNTAIIDNLLRMAEARDKYGNIWSHELPTTNKDWDSFCTVCQGSLMSVDGEALDELIGACGVEREKYAEIMNVFGGIDDPEWKQVQDALAQGRITATCRKLMEIYLDKSVDKPSMRNETKTQIEGHAKHGITKDMFPPCSCGAC